MKTIMQRMTDSLKEFVKKQQQRRFESKVRIKSWHEGADKLAQQLIETALVVSSKWDRPPWVGITISDRHDLFPELYDTYVMEQLTLRSMRRERHAWSKLAKERDAQLRIRTVGVKELHCLFIFNK